jgi:hypothetical protein
VLVFVFYILAVLAKSRCLPALALLIDVLIVRRENGDSPESPQRSIWEVTGASGYARLLRPRAALVLGGAYYSVYVIGATEPKVSGKVCDSLRHCCFSITSDWLSPPTR